MTTTIYTDLENELKWLEQVLETKRLLNANEKGGYVSIDECEEPQIQDTTFGYGKVVFQYNLDREERLILILALAPHIHPKVLNPLTNAASTVAFGGAVGKDFKGFLPTGETVLFICAEDNVPKKIELHKLLGVSGKLVKNGILQVSQVAVGEPVLSGALIVSEQILGLLIGGELHQTRFSMSFPAELLTTQMEWEDLVLNHITARQLEEIETWIVHKEKMMNDWGMGKKLKQGYRVIFEGPPGTGKSLTAALLGKKTGKEVYRIDLSKVISKYIGETEKNLANVFNVAEHKDWILFFDEADALFGKRTNVNNAHDRYANQEVSYLLQRIENYDGLVILASNLKSNMDTAFLRRFQTDIYFPFPKATERLRIWEKSFPTMVTFHENVDLTNIAHEYEIAGGSIINVVQFCSLRALKRGSTEVELEDFIDGIRKEFHKEGKVL